jgi:hypothetical protein
VHVDWLTCWQEHPEAPNFGHVLRVDFDPKTGERVVERMLGESVEAPLSDDIPSRVSHLRVRSWGGVVEVSGNPSKWGRLEAVADGLGMEESVQLYNRLLLELGLPEFTKYRAMVQGATEEVVRTGARFRRVDLAGNLATGSREGRSAYFDWLPAQRMGRRGNQWRAPFPGGGYLISGTKKRLEVVTYDKASEVGSAVAEWRRYGERSAGEVCYLSKVQAWADGLGLVRWEIRLHTEWLMEHGCGYWGDWREVNMGEVIWLQNGAPVNVEPGAAANWAVWAEALQAAGQTARASVIVSNWVQNWMNGGDPRYGISRAEWYKRAALVRRVLGIDMRERPNIRALSIAIRREVVLRPLRREDLPEWYGQRATAAGGGRVRMAEYGALGEGVVDPLAYPVAA